MSKKQSNGYNCDSECGELLNREAREEMKLRLLRDIRIDLAVCELEGWDKMEYIRELQELLNSFGNGGVRNDVI